MLSEKLILDVDRIMYERDIKIREAEKRAEKRAEERTEKRAAKRTEAKLLEIAQNMLDIGMTVEQIENTTNLPMSKIKKLQKTNS